MLNIQCKHIFLTVTWLLLCFAASLGWTPQKPKREPFGKSLERVKWDEQKQAAVEKKRENKQGAEAVAETIRMETLLAVFDLLVVDQQNRIVTGLGKDDFEIAEDSVLQQAATFALEDGSSVPRSIVLIIDYSSSQTPYLSSSITAAQKLVEQLKPKDRMAIVTDDVALLVPFTEDRKRLKDTLESIRRRAFSAGAVGQSAQYSALFATLRELLTEEERPIIIFQTDGDQLRALRPMLPNLAYGWKPLLVEFSLEDLQKYADLTHTTIYSIYPGLRLIGLPPEEQLNRAVIMAEEVNRTDAARIRAKSLGRLTARPGLTAEQKQHALTGHLQQQLAMSWLAEQTGGWLEYLETPDQADVIYARILNSINKRYILGYYPTNTARDGRWRKVQIKVRAHPDYVVLGRDRYLVPAEEK